MFQNYFSKVFFSVLLVFIGFAVSAQIGININTITPNTHPLTIPQTSTGYTGNNGQDAITFVINNTNSYPAIMDTVKNDYNGSGTASVSLWYSTTSLSGSTTPAAPAWTQLVAPTNVTIVANQLNTVLSGFNFSIPGNTRMRFQLRSVGVTLAYTTATGTATTPDSFYNSGVALMAGDYVINGQVIGFGSQTMAFSPRAFTGEVGFSALLSTPCVGQPNHDTVVGNMNPCPGTSTCYSLAGNNPNSGLSFQWLQSAVSATGPWTVMPNDTFSFNCFIAPQPGPTWYTCVTTCDTSMLSDTATAIAVTPATFSPYSPCYCGNSAATLTNLEDIGQFTIGNLTNPATAPTPQSGNTSAVNTYTDFTGLSPIPFFIQGQTYPVGALQISSGTVFNSWFKTWIDYNHNTSWADPGEEIFSSASNAGNTYNPMGTFTVPTTALPGLTRVRAVLDRTTVAANVQPCGTYNYGETEDYVVNILAAGPHDPAVTAIQPAALSGCLDSCENVQLTISNFGLTNLDLSINNLIVRLNVRGPLGTTVYTDTIQSGFLAPQAGNSIFHSFPCVNFYEGGCYTVNTDTMTLLGSVNTNFINDSLFDAVTVCNSRPNNGGDYNLCLNDTIPTGQGLSITGCPTGFVTDSIVIPFTLSFTGTTPAAPTACAPSGSGLFGTGILPTLPTSANILSSELSVNNLQLAPLTFTTGPNLTRFSLFAGPTPPPNPMVYHGGLQGNPLTSLAFGCFNYLSNPPAIDLNAMYTAGVPTISPNLNLGHWSTNRCTATNILANCSGTTVAYLKIYYEYIPVGVSWYEQPTGGIRISDSTVFDPLITSNSIMTNSATPGTYTFYGACAADTNCRVASSVIVTTVAIDSLSFTNVNCFGDSTGTIEVAGVNTIPGALTFSISGPINSVNATGIFNNLPTGSYVVSILDTASGCTSLDSNVTITAPPAVVIDSIISSLPTCTPGGDATMTAFAQGGTGSLVYNNGGANQPSNIFINQGANTYLVTATDSLGCIDTSSHTIVAPTGPTFNSVTLTNALCFGDTTGVIVASATSGSSGIATYATTPLSTQSPMGTFTGLGANSYTVRVTDSLNCFVDSVVTITAPTQVQFASVAVTNVACNGGATGAITVAASNGTPGYNYRITAPTAIGPNTSGSFTSLPAGNHTVRITDTNGCTRDSIINITAPAVLSIDTASVTQVACNGDSTGVIAMTSTGGTGGVIYVMTTPPTGVTQIPAGTFNNLPAGTYTITGTDANGCTAVTTVTITQSPTLQITNITSTTPSCVPGCDANMTVTATGGSPLYTYNDGTTSQPSPTFMNECAGTYTVTVSDSKGCTATSTHSISAAGGPTWTASSVTTTNPLCFGDTTGTIVANATQGSSSAITYSSAPALTQTPPTSGNFSGAGAGTYTITATDGNNCSINSIVNITSPPALGFDSVVLSNVNCNGGSTGSITAYGNGGILPYMYNITAGPSTPGPQASNSFVGLTAGTYTVQLLDSNNNCTKDTMVTITQPAVLVIDTFSTTQILCNGDSTGQIVMTNTGGTNPMASYTISPNYANTTYLPLGTIGNLPAGVYTVLGTDANGCTATRSVALTEPTAFQITNITSTIPTCIPGCDATMTVTASGGVSPYASYNNGTTTQTSNVFTNQCAGVYTIVVTDANGCTATSTHTIAAPGAPTWNTINSTNVSCNGDSNGTATLTTTGGNGTVTISITSPAVVPPTVVQTPIGSGNITGLPAGTYTIQATDSIGCSIITTITITQPNLLAFTNVAVDSVDCNGGSDGSITTTVTGGTINYTYSISPNVGTQTGGVFTGLPAGPYTITVTDANGCSTSTMATVSQPAALSYTGVTVTNVSCNGANNGSIVAAGTGGVIPLSITLLPAVAPNTTPPATFTGLGGGSQTIRITDAKGCTLDSVVNIVEPALLTIDTTTGTTAILCQGDSTGILVMTSTGGTGGVTYVMTTPPTGVTQVPAGTFNNVPAGTYTITGTDASNCTAVTTITLSQPASSVIITSVTSTPPSCNPGSDGTITVVASGGTGPIMYSKNPSFTPLQASGLFSNLIGGGHVVRAQDANGCSVDTAITLTTPGAPSWTSVTSTPTTCFGDSTGTITGVATGIAIPITYTLTPLNGGTQVGGNFTNLPAGAYSIVASDANNCSIGSAINVGSAPQIIFNTVTVTNVNCNGGTTGAIASTFSGGTGPLSMSIAPGPGAPGASPANFTGLGAGVQTLTITDGSSCTRDSVVTITQPIVLLVNAGTTTNILCRGDSTGILSVSKTGGVNPVIYTIAPSYTNTLQFPAGTFTNLPAGTYVVTGTDSNGCTATTSITLTQPATRVSIASIVGVSPSCSPGSDGSITVTGAGGVNPLLYNLVGLNSPGASGTFTGLTSNTYQVRVTDGNGCTIDSSYLLAPSAAPTWSSVTKINVACFGDSTGRITGLAIGGTGPKTYTLIPSYTNTTQAPLGQFNNLPIGTYVIRATDANNCSVSSTLNITQPTAVSFVSIVSDSVNCFGGNDGSIIVTGTGGTGVLSSFRGPFTPAPGISPTISTPPTFTYNNLIAGTYVIRIRDSNNCRLDTSIIVSQPSAVAITSSSRVNVLCNGDASGSLSVTAAGGTGTSKTYTINTTPTQTNSTGTFTNLPAGTYTVVARDAYLCSASTSLTITQPTPLTHTASSTNVLCFGDATGTITITGNGGVPPYQYGLPAPITNLTGLFVNLPAGNYVGVVRDSNGCLDSTATITITAPTQIVFSNVTKQDVECFGASTGSISATAIDGTGSKMISITGPVSPPAQPSPATFANIPAGNYIITATDANNCTITSAITIVQNPEIVFNITQIEPICSYSEDGSISFQATGGVSPFTYIFDVTGSNPQGPNTQTTYNNLGAGLYGIRAIDALGCTKDTNYQLIGPDPITFTEFEITPTTCLDTEDGKLNVRATGGRGIVYTYSLEPGFIVNTSGIFRDLAPKEYRLRTTDTAGCLLDTTVIIPLPTNPMVVSITKEDLGCHGRGNEGNATANVSGGTPPYTYLWNSTPVQIEAKATGLYQGIHTVDVVDAQGCLERDTVVIAPGPCCQEIFLPNAFSPNGDGRNDEFRILSTAGMELIQFEVRNRWGIKVWESTNSRSSWDGLYGGEMAPIGTYYYVLRYKCLTDGQDYTKKGDVIIVR